MKSKQHNLTLLLVSILFTFSIAGCMQDMEEVTPQQTNNNLGQAHEIDLFRKQVLNDLNTSNVQQQLHESWGAIQFEKAITFQSANAETVAFLPLYDEADDRTQALILVVAFDKYIKYSKVQRGKLWQLPFDTNNPNQPSLLAIATAFRMLDLKIFGLDAEFGEIIGQKQVVGSTAKGIDTGIDYFASEWRNSEICTLTTYDNGETYHEACWLTDFYWVEEPLETIIIDQNSGGGGGGGVFVSPECFYWSQMGYDCSEMYLFEQDYRMRMSVSELDIFNNMSALKRALYLKNAKIASVFAEKNFPNSIYNGKGDAVRHSLFHAINTIDLGYTLSKQLGDAHEKQPPNPNYLYEWKEVSMDLHNNSVGRKWSNFLERGYSSIFESIMGAFHSGELVYLNNLDNQGRATSISALVKTNQ